MKININIKNIIKNIIKNVIKNIDSVKTKIIVVLLFLNSICLFGQAGQAPQQQPPVELQELVIEGVESVNVKAGSKQLPTPQTRFSAAELDSINPLDKQPSLLIPPPQIPKALQFPIMPNAFVKAGFGLFSTVDLLAGYRANFVGYELYGKAGINSSQGDVKNSDYQNLNLMINSDYIAPDFFWIFGGSRTLTNLSLNYSDYNLYGTQLSANRSALDLDFSLKSKGNYEGFNFGTGVGFNTYQLSQSTRNLFENRIYGFLNIDTKYENYLFGTSAELNIGNFSGKDLSFHQIMGKSAIYYDKMTLEGELGYQFAYNTKEVGQSMVAMRMILSYLPNMDYSVRAEFYTGLDKDFATTFYRQNPYLDIINEIVYPRASAIIKGIVQYQPDTKKGITINGSLNFYEYYPFFNSDSLNSVDLLFETANIIKLSTEGFWEITKNSKLNGTFGTNLAILDYQSNTIPYIPKIFGSLAYRLQFFTKGNIEIGFLYNSMQYADKNNKNELNSYFNLYGRIDYEIYQNIRIDIELNNLTNNDNYLWQGYRERGIFARLGLIWQF